MSFIVMHRMGNEVRDPDVDSLPDLIAELDTNDEEHPDVAIRTEDGWSLSAMEGGDVYWENVEGENDDVRYMPELSHDRILELFRAVARGDLDTVEQQPWQHDE